MLFEKSELPELAPELFLKPASEYRGTPFWAWNCKLSAELIETQIEIFHEMGFGGFHIHARTGLETPYMGDEFLAYVRLACEKAKRLGMLCWLYDEDRFPSGAAGGTVTEDVRFRARHLLLTRSAREDMCRDAAEFRAEAAAGGKPRGYYAASYNVLLENGYLKNYRRLAPGETPESGWVWHAYVRLASESPWFNGQTYVDVFNREAVERFIEVTHEKYFAALGKDFGGAVPAIFTDEPHMTGKAAFAFAESGADITLSYTDGMDATYAEAFGVSLLDILPEILWELPGGRVSVNRYHYHDHIAERFASAFSDTVADWCGAHGIALTGHYLSERSLYSQTLALSEAMRCYRRQQIPGIDILCDQKELSTAKQAVSVARQTGRPAVISELYGVTHWDYDFKGHKLQGDWQAALGVTVRCPHLAFMSMEGEAKRDWPASISYQSPWYKKYPYIEDHFARLNTVLTRGRAVVKVCVIHPIESYWINYGPSDQKQLVRDQLDENFENIMRWLLYGCIDFDLVSESMLPELAEAAEPGVFKVGEMEYGAVVVPDCRTVRSSTLERLEAFRRGGGKVIFAGGVPPLTDAAPSQRAAALAGSCVNVPYNKAALLEALDSERVIEIRRKDGKLSDNLFYQLRQDGAVCWLFICHVNPKRNRLDEEEHYTVRLAGAWNLTLYDTLTGATGPLAAEHLGGDTLLRCAMYAHDSLLIRMTGCERGEISEPSRQSPPVCEPAAARGGAHAGYSERRVYGSADAIKLSEPNALLLDRARYRLNGGELSGSMEILRLDNELRAKLGYPRRQDAITQPWKLSGEKPGDRVTLYYEFDSETEAGSALLAVERPEDAEFCFNGAEVDKTVRGYYVDRAIKTLELPGPVRHGKNKLVIKLAFGRKTNLENIYVLGSFGVELRGSRPLVTGRKAAAELGDITRMGLPFYTGNLTYSFALEAERDMRGVCVEVTHFAGTVLEVSVDGAPKGLIAFAPHRLELGALTKGGHVLEICLYGNRFNGFGTLHNSNDEYMWYGPDSYRTEGGQWTESYLVRPAGILSRVEILMKEDDMHGIAAR